MEFYMREPRKPKRGKKKAKDICEPMNVTEKDESVSVMSQYAKSFPFLRLPPEIRNQIYSLIFDESNHSVEFEKPRAPRACLNYVSEATEVHKPVYGSLVSETSRLFSNTLSDRERRLIVNYETSLPALRFVNKQLYSETIEYLYSSPRFAFWSLRSFRSFLLVPRRINAIGSIRDLRLDVRTSGSPMCANNLVFLQKSYDGLGRHFTRLTTQLPNLRALKVGLYLQEWPIAFTFSEPWVQPFLELRKLTHLREFELIFTSPLLNRHRLPIEVNYFVVPRIVDHYTQRWTTAVAIETLHRLFAKAVANLVLGQCESCAIQEYREAMCDPAGDMALLQQREIFRELMLFKVAKDWSWVDNGDRSYADTTTDNVILEAFNDLELDIFS